MLSAATLVFEINLTRLFSVAQFYHFAFMIVSLALLGYGASGTYLAIRPPRRLSLEANRKQIRGLSIAVALSILFAYLVINALPFDSFSIAWDQKQVWILASHYLVLALPFFFSGMVVGLLLTLHPDAAGKIYATNLTGSAAGCALALVLPTYLSGEGVVLFSSALAAISQVYHRDLILGRVQSKILPFAHTVLAAALVLLAMWDAGNRIAGKEPFSWMELRISPYKSLSYALQYPSAQVIFRRWNAFSRVDVVRSPGIHSLPGLSYRYLEPPPPEDGVFVDGDDLSPIVLPGAKQNFYDYLPLAVAFRLRPAAEALVLEPRGGLDIQAASALGAEKIVAVEVNPLVVEAAQQVYQNRRVQVIIESDRSYLQRSTERFDIIILALTSSYHPVRSGAYSLGEDYRYTVESFQAALEHLDPNGYLVVTRWLQTPPSETLRAFAIAVTALERMGADPATHIVAFRGYNTGTILVKGSPYVDEELRAIRDFCAERAFDLVYAPGIRPDETNRYNILPEPVYYQSFTELLSTHPREKFYAAYPSDVRPPTDDHPFFGHFFRWSQAGEVAAELGKTWQPFGGAGYFVILALLLLALSIATVIILLPAVITRLWSRKSDSHNVVRQSLLPFLFYFGLIGLAFLIVEIPLIQRFILFLGQPSYALTAVLFTLLFFSGLGSRFGSRISFRVALPVLAALLFASPLLLPPIFSRTLGMAFYSRLGVTVLLLAPLGFLMGIPFPAGIRWVYRSLAAPAGADSGETGSSAIPMVWAVNGAASVVSAVLAALFSLSFGFGWVLRLGALFYAAAWLTVLWVERSGLKRSLRLLKAQNGPRPG